MIINSLLKFMEIEFLVRTEIQRRTADFGRRGDMENNTINFLFFTASERIARTFE
jgi:hypothetical protein